MPTFVQRRWEPAFERAGFRDTAIGFTYEAYVPDRIAGLDFGLPLGLAQELEATGLALAELQGLAGFTGLEALSRNLLRAESIGSSRIEGLRLSQRRLARAMLDPDVETETARAVVGNIHAMEEAIRLGAQHEAVRTEDILAIHRQLLEQTSDRAIGGHVREVQNWIGGSDWSPKGAEFVPPPETELGPLLLDLCRFLEREDVPAIVQAAIAHAQFETIHPFIDGNGRVGRALIHVVLRRRGLTQLVVPPVSLVLATNAQRYIEGLTAYRAGDPIAWCTFFTRALRSATEHARDFNQRLANMQEDWRAAAGHPRANSAAERLIRALPGQPIVDLRAAVALTGGSDEGARKALNELERAGVLSPVVVGKKKNRMWEARELLTLVDGFEWDLATPTRPDQRRRPAPQRRTENE